LSSRYDGSVTGVTNALPNVDTVSIVDLPGSSPRDGLPPDSIGPGEAGPGEVLPDAQLDAAFLSAALPYWHPVARSQDVSGEPSRVRLLGVDLVLWRGPDGSVRLLADQCPHRGVPLSDGTVDPDGTLRCPYHRWAFTGEGTCVDIPQEPGRPIPSMIAARAYQVDEHAGLVWACLVPAGQQRRGRPRFDEAEARGWKRYVGLPMNWAAQAARQIENFCDVGHFSVLHTDVFGNADAPAVDAYSVDRPDDGWRLEMSYRYPAVNPVAPPGPDSRRPLADLDFSYRVELPFAVWLGGAHGPGSVLFVATAPTSATTCRVFWVSAFNTADPIDEAGLQGIEDLIWAPDQRIVESQRPIRLFAAREAHRPFDRLSLAYRRALTDLGFGGS
jgi:vanillate O-demethylase monooxygenase subunit